MNLALQPTSAASIDEFFEIYRARSKDGKMPFPRAAQILVAYAAWPNNRKRRDQYMATNLAFFISDQNLQGQVKFNDVQSQDNDLRDRVGFDLFGGLESVAEVALSSLQDDLEKIQNKWPRVADIFQTTVDIAYEKRIVIRGGTSISKAIYLVEAENGLPGRSQLSAVWSEFHDVAHLITAGAYLAHRALKQVKAQVSSILGTFLLAPEIVLAIGFGFQRFGLTTYPHGRKQSILDPNSLWRILDSFAPIQPPVIVRQLTERQLELLQERRAKKNRGSN
jgi:hypothetical protein